MAALRATPFVLTADGKTRRPSELYDPDMPLFAAAFLGELAARQRYSFPWAGNLLHIPMVE